MSDSFHHRTERRALGRPGSSREFRLGMSRASNQGEFPAMSEWTDDVETEEDPSRRHDVKRAVLGGVAGVALLVGPIALANALVPDGKNDDVKTEDAATGFSLVALQQQKHA